MLKLQLDLETLENLIGKNTPFQAEIREGIVQTFAKRHLRALANEQYLKGVVREVQKELEEVRKLCMEEVMKHLPVKKTRPNYGYKGHFVLDDKHPGYTALIDRLKNKAMCAGYDAVRSVISEVKEEMIEHVEHERKQLYLTIREEVKTQMTNHFEKAVDFEIKRRLKILAQEATKEVQ